VIKGTKGGTLLAKAKAKAKARAKKAAKNVAVAVAPLQLKRAGPFHRNSESGKKRFYIALNGRSQDHLPCALAGISSRGRGRGRGSTWEPVENFDDHDQTAIRRHYWKRKETKERKERCGTGCKWRALVIYG